MNFITERVRKWMRTFLKIEEPFMQSFSIRREMDYKTNAFKNRLWYEGSGYQLNQFYKQLDDHANCCWGAVPTAGREIRKIHTGLPKIIIDKLADIVLTDLNDFDFEDKSKDDIYKVFAKENRIKQLLTRATAEALYIGDGAFKFSVDADISQYPILEWYSGDKIDIVYECGRIKEVIFFTVYNEKSQQYTLHEHYGYGYVNYELYRGETLVKLNAIEKTKNLQNVEFSGNFMMAVPYIINESPTWRGRGQSVFDNKTDSFDSLDEAYSQWVQSMRDSRPIKYIPSALLPRNPQNGSLMSPNAFDNQFIEIGDNMAEGGNNKVELHQPDFPTNGYLQTYVTALDLCLQGLISPSTLGIDNKKLDNAEAQREKEKTTLYSRNKIISAFTPVLQKLIDVMFKVYNTAQNQQIDETDVNVSFGEYANPSFEAVVETLSNPNTPMSIESKVDEMWGDSKDEEWKIEEVKRIKEQSGLIQADEPMLGSENMSIDNLSENDDSKVEIRALNGAQTQSLIGIMSQYTAKAITEGQAIKLIATAVGVTVDEAKKILDGDING